MTNFVNFLPKFEMTKSGLKELIPDFGAMNSTAKTGSGKMTLEASIKMIEFANPAVVSGHVTILRQSRSSLEAPWQGMKSTTSAI